MLNNKSNKHFKISNKKEEIPESTQAGRDFHASVKEIFVKNPELINGEQITVTDKCVGCGICTNVCPRGLFYIEDKKLKETIVVQTVTKGVEKKRKMKNTKIEWLEKIPFEWKECRIKMLFSQLEKR